MLQKQFFKQIYGEISKDLTICNHVQDSNSKKNKTHDLVSYIYT